MTSSFLQAYSAAGPTVLDENDIDSTQQPIDLFVAFRHYSPSIEEIFDRWMQNFTGQMPKSHPARELNLEIVVSPQQAARGQHVPIDVPVASICPVCDGSGVSGLFTCDQCAGHGMSWRRVRVDVLPHPGVRDGTVIPLSLRGAGVSNMYLNVHVRVES